MAIKTGLNCSSTGVLDAGVKPSSSKCYDLTATSFTCKHDITTPYAYRQLKFYPSQILDSGCTLTQIRANFTFASDSQESEAAIWKPGNKDGDYIVSRVLGASSANITLTVDVSEVLHNSDGSYEIGLGAYRSSMSTFYWYFSNISFDLIYSLPSYTITANAGTGGSVSGGGTYEKGSAVTLTAIPSTGYKFKQWSDGNTSNPRSITVSTNATYTAQFEKLKYTVSVSANPTEGGTVSGGGTYEHGSTATLKATANTGYNFKQWSDGSTNNPHSVTVTAATTYTAQFEKITYSVTVATNPIEGGTVSGGGTYEHGSTATLIATPNTGYDFKQWSDGDADNPRTVTVSANAIYTAEFDIKQYSISTISNPTYGGTTIGGGTYNYGTTLQISATPEIGYKFTKWEDGNQDNPRTILITENSEGAVYTAVFEKIIYNIPVFGDYGLIEVYGTRTYDTTATITATPYVGYRFIRWTDGETLPIRSLHLSQDIINNIPTYTAEFQKVDLSQNTIDKVGDETLTKSIITKQVTEFIDNNAIRIGDRAFYNCQNLNFTHIHKVREVGENAFYNCNQLISIKLPLELTGLGEYAFLGCSNLNALILPANNLVVLTNSNTLEGTAIASGHGYIYVPNDMIEHYLDNTNWNCYMFRAIEDYSELCGMEERSI